MTERTEDDGGDGELDAVELEDIDWLAEASIVFINDQVQGQRVIAMLLKQAGATLPINSSYSNDSSVVNKFRTSKDVSRLSLGNINNDDNNDSNKPPSYVIPGTSSATSHLQFVNCQLKDVTMIFQHVLFPRLVYLNVSFNALRDISPPTIAFSFANLRLLDISHNRFSSLEFVSSLSKLTVLRCQYNQIESLSPVQYLSQLDELWISNNKIDWMQLMYLSTLTKLTKLVKVNTPANEKVKVDEFLVTIVPSLQYIDQDHATKWKSAGRNVVQSTNNVSADTNTIDVSTGKMSTDVRIMITQAKAMLKRELDTTSSSSAATRLSDKVTNSSGT
jgi:Leucine-rich repeat (LRR) protein